MSPGPAVIAAEIPDIPARLAAIGTLLRNFRPLWQGHAFREPVLAWEKDLPGLAQRLRGLPEDRASQVHADPAAARTVLRDWLPVDAIAALESVPSHRLQTLAAWPRGIARDVPGRKWAQIEAFVAAVPAVPGLGVVDWCAGKGHLARALAVQWGAQGVCALERDPRLTGEATRRARELGLPVHGERCDVMSARAEAFLDDTRHGVALHACGDLHGRLIVLGAAKGVPALSIAPCCYHLTREDPSPLSCAGAAAWPGMAAADLRTAVQETVTAGASVRRRRRQVQCWQLGLDALLRERSGRDVYTPLPAAESRLLSGSFAQYCRTLEDRLGIRLPAGCDFAAWERRGQQRFREVSALDAVRHAFRRVLELWLVLDRAMYLMERGYAVSVGVFCERSLSPRNLLLLARRDA